MKKTTQIDWMRSMMKSLYAYDSLTKDSNYLTEYKEKLGEETFNQVYDEYEKELKDTYTVKRGVYTDGEDCTYNELVEK